MQTIEELKNEIEKIEKKISEEYKKCPYDFDEQQSEHFKWYVEKIEPLSKEQKRLQGKLYSAMLLGVKVGEGVTIWSWTDRYAYTVVSRTPKTITIQRDTAQRIDHNGMSECQEYSYTQNPEGEKKTFRWSNKKNRWVNSCYGLCLGRDEYYDFSF